MRTNRSWFSLLTFCASVSLAAALALAAVFTGASAVMAVAAPATVWAEEPGAPAPQPNFSGVITDSQCGPRHAEGSGKSPAECTLACVRSGKQFSLVNGDKNYTLQGNQQELNKWAGQRVTVFGIRAGDTIAVSSITGAQ